MTLIEIENLHIRDDGDTWAVGGNAITWNSPANVKDIDPTTGAVISYVEEFAPNSILIPAEGVLLRDVHGKDVGLLTRSKTNGEGWEVELEIDKTPEGAKVRQELKEGKKHSFSIGFSDIETKFDALRNVYRRTKALVKEISVTGTPQHLNTGVQYVRSNPTDKEKNIMSEETKPETTEAPATPPAPQANENLLTRSELEDALRDLRGELKDQLHTRSEPTRDFRSPGEFLKALAAGDKATVKSYETLLTRSNAELVAASEMLKTRAFPTEGILANSILLDSWVGDLTRLVDEPAILKNVFSTGTLPSTGMSIEYGALVSDATVVDEQEAEGDNLDYGYVDIELKTAPVKTYGGYSRLSRQAIERSSVSYLDTVLRAQALRAGKRVNISIRSAFTAAYAAQVTAGNKVTISDETSYASITDALVDGVDLLLDEGLTADYLVVDKASFKALKNVAGADDRPQMLMDGAGVNNIGAINLAGLTGRLAGIQVVCDPNMVYDPAGTVNATAALVNSQAIRFRSSGIAQLTAENIVNLSNDFSLYFYAAIATEIPKGIIPVEITL